MTGTPMRRPVILAPLPSLLMAVAGAPATPLPITPAYRSAMTGTPMRRPVILATLAFLLMAVAGVTATQRAYSRVPGPAWTSPKLPPQRAPPPIGRAPRLPLPRRTLLPTRSRPRSRDPASRLGKPRVLTKPVKADMAGDEGGERKVTVCHQEEKS